MFGMGMTTDWASVLSTVKRRCAQCGQYKDAPMWALDVRKVSVQSWVCPDCRETMAEGLSDDNGPVVGDPD